MPTPTQPIPASPSSHTRALWPADPTPQHWPAPIVDARALMAARRAAVAAAEGRDGEGVVL